MATTPNDSFTAGQVLSSTECNNFPRGVMAAPATSSTNYTLTTSEVIATGMTVTFTAEANRYYKITYIEPAVNTPTVISGSTILRIRQSNAVGQLIAVGYLQTPVAVALTGSVVCCAVVTFSAGSVTVVGTAIASSTTGTPLLNRLAGAYALLTVEDIGTA